MAAQLTDMTPEAARMLADIADKVTDEVTNAHHVWDIRRVIADRIAQVLGEDTAPADMSNEDADDWYYENGIGETNSTWDMAGAAMFLSVALNEDDSCSYWLSDSYVGIEEAHTLLTDIVSHMRSYGLLR